MTEEKENINELCCKSGVKFNSALRVVLIPSRGEYKSAGLCPELWWTSSDYFMFQQSAHSEIRLLSAYENINLNAARKKLYQPSDNEAIEDSSSSSTAESVNDSEKLKNKIITKNNRNVHSLNSDDAKDDDEVFETDLAATEKTTLSSPNPSTNSNGLKRVDSLTHLKKVCNNVMFEENNEYNPIEPSSELLSFCVPLKETVLLRFDCNNHHSGKSKISITFSVLITYGSLLILIAFLVMDTNGYLY